MPRSGAPSRAREAGWDVEPDGVFGAPPVRVLVGANAHTTVFAALRMLGLGSRA